MTFNNSRNHCLADAVLTTMKPRQASRALCALFAKSIVEPETYMSQEIIDGDDLAQLDVPEPELQDGVS
jgi:hypothetical protein